MLIAAMLIAAVVAVIALQQHGQEGMPPPRLFTWSSQAALDSRTPQEALAAGLTWTPCVNAVGRGVAARTSTVTWLATTSDFGVALIYSDCAQGRIQRVLSLFTLGKEHNHWMPQAGFSSNVSTSAKLSPAAVMPPPWPPVPPDLYGEWHSGPPGINPPASMQLWYSHTQAFVMGHAVEGALRPTGALAVRLSGRTAWETRHAGIVSIVLQLPDGTTFFFAGSGSPDQIDELAASARSHMGEVLTPLT